MHQPPPINCPAKDVARRWSLGWLSTFVNPATSTLGLLSGPEAGDVQHALDMGWPAEQIIVYEKKRKVYAQADVARRFPGVRAIRGWIKPDGLDAVFLDFCGIADVAMIRTVSEFRNISAIVLTLRPAHDPFFCLIHGKGAGAGARCRWVQELALPDHKRIAFHPYLNRNGKPMVCAAFKKGA